MMGARVLGCGQTLAEKHIDLATHCFRGKTPTPIILGASIGVRLCLFTNMPNICDQSQRRKEIIRLFSKILITVGNSKQLRQIFFENVARAVM